MFELKPLLPLLERFLGHRPSPATIWRWHRKGVGSKRVRLPATRVGGKLYATPEDVQRFIAAQNPPADQDDAEPVSEREEETTRRLEKARLI